ncbi:MAG: ankyrin repeat domain-containing protein [Acidobacteria bacterium]|nr:ankyrin repeat domain-containing protein [Acidobacteriota bacterium]
MDIFEAIQANDSAAFAQLLDSDASQSNARHDGGATPILWAIYHGRPELAHELVRRGASVSFAEACALGDEAKALAMLNESSIDQRSEDGFPPVSLAIFFGHGALARQLIERGANVNAAAENAQRVAPVHAAAAVCDRETMRMLLERGADPNAKQQGDFTPLHGAASRGDREMAELLLAHGADRQAKSADGKTPADVARERGYPSIGDFLASE